MFTPERPPPEPIRDRAGRRPRPRRLDRRPPYWLGAVALCMTVSSTGPKMGMAESSPRVARFMRRRLLDFVIFIEVTEDCQENVREETEDCKRCDGSKLEPRPHQCRNPTPQNVLVEGP